MNKKATSNPEFTFMSEPEEFIFKQTVKVVDSKGEPIRVGDVVQQQDKDNFRGVVMNIIRPTSTGPFPGPVQVGDMIIKRKGTTTVSNEYNSWTKIPHADQTYDERFASWMAVPFEHDEEYDMVKDKTEALAVDGIMNLLPEDTVDWEYGSYFPDSIENALDFLVAHLNELKQKKIVLRKNSERD